VDKWNRHEIVVIEDMVAFVEVPFNLKQFFHNSVPQAIFFMLSLSSLDLAPLYVKNPSQ
jgi:hypothetical protein